MWTHVRGRGQSDSSCCNKQVGWQEGGWGRPREDARSPREWSNGACYVIGQRPAARATRWLQEHSRQGASPRGAEPGVKSPRRPYVRRRCAAPRSKLPSSGGGRGSAASPLPPAGGFLQRRAHLATGGAPPRPARRSPSSHLDPNCGSEMTPGQAERSISHTSPLKPIYLSIGSSGSFAETGSSDLDGK